MPLNRVWRTVPAPKRGELVRLLGEELRAHKAALGRLVTIEAGKIVSEGGLGGSGDDRHLRLRRSATSSASSTASPCATERPSHRM